MTTVSEKNNTEFYKFLYGEKSIEELEKFIYTQQNLEQQLGSETYLSLIELNFKDKYEKEKLIDIVRNKIIDEGQFETWKLKRILNDFLTQPEKMDLNLDKIYHLFCGIYQDNGQRKYEYKFLGNLGLNYLYWTEEGYLKTHYGDNWKTEYEKCKSEFVFYHEQLKNIASEILLAIDINEIEILNDGTYRISHDLKNKLETDEIYKLKHKNEKDGN
jgi:hypothetical protein